MASEGRAVTSWHIGLNHWSAGPTAGERLGFVRKSRLVRRHRPGVAELFR